jgi:hypothetical protein
MRAGKEWRVGEEEESGKELEEMEAKDWIQLKTMRNERYSCTIDLSSNLNYTVHVARN